MEKNKKYGYISLGIFIFLGLSVLGYFISNSIIEFKKFDRSVVVKGLSEKEVNANIVIWPIKFQLASNNLEDLYKQIENNNSKIESFLVKNGAKKEEITISTPSIFDRLAQQYSDNSKLEFRYTASSIVTFYSSNILLARELQSKIISLGKDGIIFASDDYNAKTQYIYTNLNELKPEMIEEATKEARGVAQKFAQDSQSRLGKIKKASQGQFAITQRDTNNPHIKKVRVVSTVEYYLVD